MKPIFVQPLKLFNFQPLSIPISLTNTIIKYTQRTDACISLLYILDMTDEYDYDHDQ